MARLDVDLSKLVRLSTYAERRGITRQGARRRVEYGNLDAIVIDGITFVEDLEYEKK